MRCWDKVVPGNGNGRSKGPEVGMSLGYLGKGREATVAGIV